MPYTKQELKDAYCRARNCTEADLPRMEALAQSYVDQRKDNLQAELNAVPATGKEQMKVIALEQLAKESAEQAVIDNAGVNL